MDSSARAAGDAGLCAGSLDELDHGVGVIAAVCDDGDGSRQAGQELRDGAHVGGLAGGDQEPHRQAVLIDDGGDLGAQSATRTANGVIRAPFLPPAACWWARMIELSISCIDCGEAAASASNT